MKAIINKTLHNRVALVLLVMVVLGGVGYAVMPQKKNTGRVLPASIESIDTNDSIVKKDESGVLAKAEGETELISERTRNFKKFSTVEKTKDGKVVYRVAGDIAPIHYKLDDEDEAENYKEIDLTTVAGDGGADGDYKMTHSGFQMRVWNQRSDAKNAVYYIGRFERKGKWIEMAPLELYYENEKGEIQTISSAVGGITPTIDNNQYYIEWKDAFGAGIDFRYNLNQTSLFKTVVINDGKSLPVPKIDTTGLMIKLSMSMLWDDTVSAEDPTIGTYDTSTKSLVTDPVGAKTVESPEEKEITSDLSYKYDEKDIWWLKKPVAWDSAEEPRIFDLGYEFKQTETAILSTVALDYKNLAKTIYPFYIDASIDEEQIGASSDDVTSTNVSTYQWGYLNRTSDYVNSTLFTRMHFGMRWTTIPLPQGSIINSAYVSLYVHSTSYDDPDCYFYGDDSDDAPTFNIVDDTPASRKGTDPVYWNATGIGAGFQQSIDISSIVQAITDRPGWLSGNSLVVVASRDTRASKSLRAYTWDYSGNDRGAKLNVSYSEPSTVVINGVCKKNDRSTSCADFETVKVAINGDLQTQTGTTSSGGWEIAGVAEPDPEAIITVFVDGVDDSLEANAVTKYDGSGDISGVALYERHLTIGSDDNQTISNSDLANYDNSVSSDEDIFFEVDANNDLLVPQTGTSTSSDQFIYILGSNTYRPDSAGSGNVSVPNLEIATSGALTADGNTITISGTGTPFVVNGTFTSGTSTIKYTGAGDTNITATTYYNLETTNILSAGLEDSWYVDEITIEPDYNGRYDPDGTYGGKTRYKHDTSNHWLLWGYGAWMLTPVNYPEDWPFEGTGDDLPANPWSTYSGSPPVVTQIGNPVPTYTFAAGTITVEGNYTNGDGTNEVTTTADTNDPTININGSFVNSASATFIASASASFSVASNFTNSATGTFTHSSGTLTLDGQGLQTITTAGDAFNNLIITNDSAGGITFADSTAVAGTATAVTPSTTLTFTGGTTHTWNTINLNGQALGTEITLQSSNTSDWLFVVTAQTAVSYVDVSHSDASGGIEIDASDGTNIDSDDNTYWNFGAGSVDPVNDSLTFTNAYSGLGNTAVSDDTTQWNFEAKVTDADGPTDINYVELRLANSSDSTQPYDSLKFRWTESTDTFSEQADTQDAATISSNSSDSSSSGNQWTLNFKIKFNNEFLAKDTNYAVELYSVDDSLGSDTDNYVDKYQVTALSLSINLDDDALEFGNLLPSSVITGTTVATVTTNYPNGYSLSVHDSVAGTDSALLRSGDTVRIADYAGTIITPTTWSGTGLGICLYSATQKEAKWGTGATEDSIDNKYSGVPESITAIHNKTGSPTVSDANNIGYKMVVPNTQKTGDYSGVITYTATGALI